MNIKSMLPISVIALSVQAENYLDRLPDDSLIKQRHVTEPKSAGCLGFFDSRVRCACDRLNAQFEEEATGEPIGVIEARVEEAYPLLVRILGKSSPKSADRYEAVRFHAMNCAYDRHVQEILSGQDSEVITREKKLIWDIRSAIRAARQQ